jgi:hypothetical protein
MTLWGIAPLVAAAALAGCGGGDDSGSTQVRSESSLSGFLGKLPLGYRYAPAPKPELERAFREKVARDFDAREVEIRSVYIGAQFVAGEAAVRAGRTIPIDAIADKVLPGHLRVKPVTIAGKRAHLVVGVSSAGEPDLAIVDTIGRVIVIVTAQRYAIARKLAASVVR